MAANPNNIQQLPLVPSIAFQEFDTVLETTPFTIKVRWNTRDAAWYFDLLDANQDPIVSGIKIMLGTALGARTTDPRMPGVFVAADLGAGNNNDERDATFDDLGTRVVVYYYPFTEFFA